MSTNTFEAEFRRRIDSIKERAQAVGSSITGLCETTGIARATPDRWLAKAPKTIASVDILEAALVELEKQAAAK